MGSRDLRFGAHRFGVVKGSIRKWKGAYQARGCAGGWGSSWPVNIASVIDRHNRDDMSRVVNLIDHPEITTPSTVLSDEFEAKGPSDLIG